MSDYSRLLKSAVALVSPESDRDGALFYMGADPAWTPDREGQAPAQLPPVGQHSRHDWDTCPTCGRNVGADYLSEDERLTCAGCLRASEKLEKRLLTKYQQDEAKEEVRRKAREEAAQPKPFAQRRRKTKAAS